MYEFELSKVEIWSSTYLKTSLNPTICRNGNLVWHVFLNMSYSENKRGKVAYIRFVTVNETVFERAASRLSSSRKWLAKWLVITQSRRPDDVFNQVDRENPSFHFILRHFTQYWCLPKRQLSRVLNNQFETDSKHTPVYHNYVVYYSELLIEQINFKKSNIS